MNPHATNHPVTWFKRFHEAGELDLSPAFQRRPVWSDAQASYLIDTILNNLPIPEIFVRTITSGDGDTRVEVVDGQQRLRAIIRFFTNDLVLSGEKVTAQWADASWEGLGKDDRDHFWQFKIVVRELEGASDAEVRDMFQRLNANQSSLNDQELRHSQYDGAFISAVEKLADDSWWLRNGIATPAQVRRMVDAEYMSELLVGVIGGPLDKKKGLDDYYADYDEDFPDEDRWVTRFLAARDLATKLVDGSFRGWSTKTEFYSFFLACARFVLDGIELTDEEIEGAQVRLGQFRRLADAAKRKGNKEPVPEVVDAYAEAVTRASTDLSRRLLRIETVQQVIDGTLTFDEFGA